MAAYKRTDKKGWYISFYFKNTKIKIMNWKKINGINKTFDTKSEAQLAESQYKLKLTDTAYNLTLYNAYDEFVATTKASLKESTLLNYRKFKRNYLIAIDDKNIKELEIRDITIFKQYLLSSGVSIQTKNRMKNILLELLKYLNLMYEVKANIQLPLLEALKDNTSVLAPKPKYIPPNDFKALMKPLLDYIEYYNYLYYYTIFILLYNTGIRIGEAAALNVSDVKNDYIVINKDYIRISGKDIIQTTKSKNSIRNVYLDNETKEILNNYILKYKPSGVLFRLESNYITQARLRTMLSKLGKLTGLDKKYEIKVHNLRHSHASNLRQLGYDEVAISKRLGNTPNVAITTYMHSLDTEQQEIAEKLEKLNK